MITRFNLYKNIPAGEIEPIVMSKEVFSRHSQKCFSSYKDGFLNKVKYEKQDEFPDYIYKYFCLGCGDRGLSN
mgnify:CR=1 FL=1